MEAIKGGVEVTEVFIKDLKAENKKEKKKEASKSDAIMGGVGVSVGRTSNTIPLTPVRLHNHFVTNLRQCKWLKVCCKQMSRKLFKGCWMFNA